MPEDSNKKPFDFNKVFALVFIALVVGTLVAGLVITAVV